MKIKSKYVLGSVLVLILLAAVVMMVSQNKTVDNVIDMVPQMTNAAELVENLPTEYASSETEIYLEDTAPAIETENQPMNAEPTENPVQTEDELIEEYEREDNINESYDTGNMDRFTGENELEFEMEL